MPRTIMGLETRACINGLTKTDFENVKQIPVLESETNQIKNTTIPALDDRITALEQGGSGGGSEWEEVDVSTYNKANAQVNALFELDENDRHETKYEMIVVFGTDVYHIKSGVKIEIMGDDSQMFKISTSSTATQLQINTAYITLSNIFMAQSSYGGTYFTCYYYAVKINKSDGTVTVTNFTENKNRNILKVFVKRE